MADTPADASAAGLLEPTAISSPDPWSGLLAEPRRPALDLLADQALHTSSEPGADIRTLLREAAFRALI